MFFNLNVEDFANFNCFMSIRFRKNQTLAALVLLVRRINYKRFVYILIIEHHLKKNHSIIKFKYFTKIHSRAIMLLQIKNSTCKLKILHVQFLICSNIFNLQVKLLVCSNIFNLHVWPFWATVNNKSCENNPKCWKNQETWSSITFIFRISW